MRVDACRLCGTRLPSDRLEVALEEERAGTSRSLALAARLRSNLCLACSAPKDVSGWQQRVAGEASRVERQRSKKT